MGKKKSAAKVEATETKINKSEVIRTYLAENPDVKPKAAAEALTKQTGIEITPAFVSQIKIIMKKKSGGAVATKGKPGRKKAASANGDMGPVVGQIEAASAFVKSAGSLAAAKRILEALGAWSSGG